MITVTAQLLPERQNLMLVKRHELSDGTTLRRSIPVRSGIPVGCWGGGLFSALVLALLVSVLATTDWEAGSSSTSSVSLSWMLLWHSKMFVSEMSIGRGGNPLRSLIRSTGIFVDMNNCFSRSSTLSSFFRDVRTHWPPLCLTLSCIIAILKWFDTAWLSSSIHTT